MSGEKKSKGSPKLVFLDILSAFSGSKLGVEESRVRASITRVFGVKPRTISNWFSELPDQVRRDQGIIYVEPDALLTNNKTSPISKQIKPRDMMGSGLRGKQNINNSRRRSGAK